MDEGDRSSPGTGLVTRRRALLVAGVVVVAAVVFVFVWFQPHKAFIDDEVDEPAPTAGGAPSDMIEPDEETDEDMPETDIEPEVLARGTFEDRSHPTSGTAEILRLPDGSRYLRIEDLDTDNGPDLFVYLSPAGPDAGTDEVEQGAVNLGRLKGNLGDQNYEVPADVDLDGLSTVFVWCDRFSVVFGAAGLA